MLSGGEAPSSARQYKNDTLLHNWYEDRLGTQEKDPRKLNTTERVVCRDFEPEVQSGLYVTSKQATDHSCMTSPPPRKVTRPSLYSSRTLEGRLNKYGQPADTYYTQGRTTAPLPSEPEAEGEQRHLTTTNQVFYEQKPVDDRTTKPVDYFASTDRSHYVKHAEFLDRFAGGREGGREGWCTCIYACMHACSGACIMYVVMWGFG